MKICPQCQTENLDVAWRCKSCGAEFSKEEHPQDLYKLAKTSFIFGCLSALVVPAIIGALLNSMIIVYISMVMFGIVAVATGAGALLKLKHVENRKGKGLAIAGIVLGGIFSVLALCSFAGLFLGPLIQENFEEINRNLMRTPGP